MRAATIHGNSDGRRRSSSGGESGDSGNSWVDSRELSMHRAKHHSSTDVNDTGGYSAVVVDDESNRCNNSSSGSSSSGGGGSRTRSHGGSGGSGGSDGGDGGNSNVIISNVHHSSACNMSGSTTGTDVRTSYGSGDRLDDATVDAVEEDSPSLSSSSSFSSSNKKSHTPLVLSSSSPSSSSSYSFVPSSSTVSNSKSSPSTVVHQSSSGSATGSTVNSNNNSKAGKKIELTYEEMARYFNAPQPLAARLLGVSYVLYQIVCLSVYLFPLTLSEHT